jgi:methylated-DNA-[protein]-cysteine S-methyltransferase
MPMRLWLDRRASPIGDMLIAWDADGQLRVLDFAGFEPRMLKLLRLHYGEVMLASSPAPAFIAEPISRYFSGELAAPDKIEVATGGTEFHKAVWSALRNVRPGERVSYGDPARRLGRQKAVRAVGGANGANPIGVVVPCHRIVGSGGALHRLWRRLASKGVAADPRGAIRELRRPVGEPLRKPRRFRSTSFRRL